MNGFLLVDKPVGMTSFSAVAMCRRVFGTQDIGHSGTLDPFATGLLLLAFGEAKKMLEYLPSAPKIYSGTAILGSSSDSFDKDGVIVEQVGLDVLREKVSREVLEKCINENLLGKISQTPPKYSAIKIDGIPAHRRMRNGQDVTIPPREVEIFSFEVLSVDLPRFTFRCSVSTGTYIRSLIQSIGDILEVGAYMEELRREQIGPFVLADSHTVEALETLSEKDFLPLEIGVTELPRVDLSEEEFERLRNGLYIGFAQPQLSAGFLQGNVVAILEAVGTDQLKVKKLLHR